MNSLPVITWELSETVQHADIFSGLSSEFEIEIKPAISSTLRFYDDFDAHLWQANYLLCNADKQKFQLIAHSGCIDTVSAPGDARFWWEFRESEVKAKLQKLIGLRAILLVASLRLLETDFSLRNSDQKIVVKGRLTQSMGGDQPTCYCTLRALRGYSKFHTRAAQILEPLIKAKIKDFGLKCLLEAQDLEVFKSKQGNSVLLLTVAMQAEPAVRSIALAMLDQAERHVRGVIADTDTEFLHQFRVNVRKLRSLISLLKKTLPTTLIDTLKPKLSLIAGKTNKLRDLDVLILAHESYRTMLPANFESGLNKLYGLIEKQRKQEKNKVARYLSSKDYKATIASCAAEFSLNSVFETAMASKSIARVVKKLILKRYHKMLAMCQGISCQSPDENIHALRIEFKKLRYLIEFFVDLLPKKRIVKIVGEIKKIQTILGDYNDYGVQIVILNGYVDDALVDMSNSLSGLIAILHQKKIEKRSKVESAIADFFTENMTNEFNLVFGIRKTKGLG